MISSEKRDRCTMRLDRRRELHRVVPVGYAVQGIGGHAVESPGRRQPKRSRGIGGGGQGPAAQGHCSIRFQTVLQPGHRSRLSMLA